MDLEKPGLKKTLALTNLDSKKHGTNIGLKNMSNFRELCLIKTMRNVICCLKVRVLIHISTKFFRLNIVLIITHWKMEVLKFTFLIIKYRVCRQYWSNEQICLELKVWMSSFLNNRSSHLEVSNKKVFLKLLQNSLKKSKISVMQSLI